MTFSIRNWAKFQHYTKRHPPWIKLYHDLLDDDDFAALDHFAQLLYFKLLMAASRKDNRIPEDVAWMATELSLPKTLVQKSLKTLLDSGFLASTDASNPASKRASNGASSLASKNASPSRAPARSRESEAEEEPLGSSSSNRSGARATPASAGRAQTNAVKAARDVALARIRNIGAELPINDLTAELRDALGDRYDQLTDDDLVELRDLHADLVGAQT